MIGAKGIIMEFGVRLELYTPDIYEKIFFQFSNLNSVIEINQTLFDSEVFLAYIEKLKFNLNKRFEDLRCFYIPVWVLDPFNTSALALETDAASELIMLQNNIQMKIDFQNQGYMQFWLLHKHSFPLLWGKIKLLFWRLH